MIWITSQCEYLKDRSVGSVAIGICSDNHNNDLTSKSEKMSNDSDAESISSSPMMTTTLLGYVDIAISEDEPLYAKDSFIGGQPLPMDQNSPIPSNLVHCKNCNKPMRLLIQCSADLPDTYYDRALYVFICIEAKCRRKEGSVRAIRGLRKDEKEMQRRENEEKEQEEAQKLEEQEQLEKEREAKDMVQNLFSPAASLGAKLPENPFASSTANPFATTSNPFDTKSVATALQKIQDEKPTFADVAKTSVAKANATSKYQCIEKQDVEYNLPEFKGFILYFEQEKLDPSKQKLPPIPENLKIEEEGEVVEDSTSSINVQQGNLPKINPEKNKETEDLSKLFDDQTFQNFTRIVSYNTQQVLRYEPDGSPILYSSKDKVSRIFYAENGKFKDRSEWNIPSPAYNPSGSRRFEMQLMPKMIIDLENDIDDIQQIMQNGMEWGTIIVATDSEDFVPLNWLDKNGVAYLEEWCGVQWEEGPRL